MSAITLHKAIHRLRSSAAIVLVCGAVPFAVLIANPVHAALTGDAALVYTSYDGSNDKVDPLTGAATGRNHMSSSSLTQNYSLMYSSSGTVYNSRVGRYAVSLGYNWSALDTKLSSSNAPTESFNETRGHLLYSGEIVLDPKEVPFRLNAYSRDMTRNSFANQGGVWKESFQSILGSRDEATGIYDGIHIESGATLIAGVKNGMTNGYNEVLRHFPMILLDYKDSINRDLRSKNPVDDRLSRLAFVSLNKKDNWFHYRHTLYTDNINRLNNYVEDEIQLGTVDQYMTRRWIDFANWIKVSTDIQFSQRKSNRQNNPIEEVNLNLFVEAERKTWNVRAFTNFYRNRDENLGLSYQTSLPVYASGAVSPDLSWNARTSYRSNQDISLAGNSARFTDLVAGYRVESFKRAPFTLSQGFDVETSNTAGTETLTLAGSLETTSTSKFSRDITLGGAYKVKSTASNTPDVSTTDFLEQMISVNAGYSAADNFRIDFRQYNTFTDGATTDLGNGPRNSSLTLGQYVGPRNLTGSQQGNKTYHSVSTFLVSWVPQARLSTYLTITEDIYKTSTLGVNPATEVLGTINYSNDAWNINGTSKYNHGSREFVNDQSESIVSSVQAKYIHSRNLDTSVSVSQSFSSSGGVNSSAIDIDQKLNYHHFTKAGITRKLFEINEAMQYANGTSNLSRSFLKSISLGFKYYPIRQLTLAGGMGYSYDRNPADYTLIWNTSIAANFKLLQASLDYVHGIRKIDGVRENRFTGSIRRSF